MNLTNLTYFKVDKSADLILILNPVLIKKNLTDMRE